MKSLICTLGFKPEAVITSIKMFGGDKLIIVYGGIQKDTHKRVKDAVETIKAAIPETFIPSKYIQVEHYDISAVTRLVRDLIREEYTLGNEIFVNVSGGRKTLAFATQMACYIEYDKVSRLFYITEEDDKYIELPIIRWKLSDTKRQILWIFQTGDREVKSIAERLDISNSMIYKHINELAEDGFLHRVLDKFEPTQIGMIMAENINSKGEG